MQKWEYLTVAVYYPGQGYEFEPTVASQNGKGIPKGTTRDAYFGQLGDQGWELACVSVLSSTSYIDYTFKRPKL